MVKTDIEGINELTEKIKKIRSEISKVIIGQDDIITNILNCIFSRGHCLLIGVPGLAKTLLVNTISQVLGLKFSRIQFTPDLMPSDILGFEILDESRHFKFVKGPVFGNIILADEINRTPPKTQSALLEAMQEYAVTAAGTTYNLDKPFFVLATQNPIEQEGTYPLPEAQLDRFMFNILFDYPTLKEEIEIVSNTTYDKEINLDIILTKEEIIYYQNILRKIPVPNNVIEFAVNLTSKTRPKTSTAHEIANKYIEWGAGPRASQYLIIGAKFNAIINSKYSPDIEDVVKISSEVLRHRIVRNYKAEADGIKNEDLIKAILK